MSKPLDIIIVERLGSLKMLSVKDFKLEDLYKKCGFKKADDFNKQTEWNVKMSGKKYTIHLYAKTDGRANSENKYDFPPPVDAKLFYGSCALVCYDAATKLLTNLRLDLWNKIYEKLFGGFEDLSATAKEDEEEEDELENVPKEKKTKQGYLKDGFVVDSSDPEESSESVNEDEEDEEDDEYDEEDESEDDDNEDVGSELSEESYDYNDDNVGK